MIELLDKAYESFRLPGNHSCEVIYTHMYTKRNLQAPQCFLQLKLRHITASFVYTWIKFNWHHLQRRRSDCSSLNFLPLKGTPLNFIPSRVETRCQLTARIMLHFDLYIRHQNCYPIFQLHVHINVLINLCYCTDYL